MREELSISELENFVESRIWKAIVQFSIKVLDDKINMLITTDAFKEPALISKEQGFIEGIQQLIDYPAILKEQIEYEQQEEKWKEDGKQTGE